MLASEIRDMEPAAIQAEVERLRREVLELRCQIALGKEVKANRLREARKDIARLKTVLREKEGAV